MKKILLSTIIGLLTFGIIDAQNVCRTDTTYFYKFINGNSIKTPIHREIYLPSSGNLASTYRPYVVQEYKNGVYVNKIKRDVVFNSSCSLPIEDIYSNWDSASATWIAYKKTNATFNANCNVTEYTEQVPNNNGVLENYYRTLSSYNTKENITLEQTFTWVNGAWRNNNRYTYSYQSDTLRKNELIEKWDTTTAQWVNVSKTEYSFDAIDRITNFESYNWNEASSSWKGAAKQVTTYDTNGIASVESYYWDNTNDVFLKSTKNIYTRNVLGLVLTDESQYWSLSTMQYIRRSLLINTYNANNFLTGNKFYQFSLTTGSVTNSSRLTYTLDASGRSLVVFDEDSSSQLGAVWRPFRRWTYAYDANGNKTDDLYEQRGNSPDTILSNISKQEFHYDVNNNVTKEINERWDKTANTWLPNAGWLRDFNVDGCLVWAEQTGGWNTSGNYFNNHNRWEYKLTEVSVGLEDEADTELYLYPNPTNNILNIQTDATIEVITIYNLQGQNMMNITSNNNQLDLSNLSEGAYILQINTTEGIVRRTIIKE